MNIEPSQIKKVKDHEDFFRGPGGEIVNSNIGIYDAYMRGLEVERKKELEMNALQDDVSMLKSELGQIKSLLLTLVNNQGNTYGN